MAVRLRGWSPCGGAFPAEVKGKAAPGQFADTLVLGGRQDRRLDLGARCRASRHKGGNCQADDEQFLCHCNIEDGPGVRMQVSEVKSALRHVPFIIMSWGTAVKHPHSRSCCGNSC